MDPTTDGRFRVFEDPRGEGWLFVRVDGWTGPDGGAGGSRGGDDPGGGTGPGDTDGPEHTDDSAEADGRSDGDRDPFEPVAVPRAGHGDLDPAVGDLRPGYLVDATLSWADEDPRVTDLSVRKRTLLEFVDGASTVFQAAAQTWADARASGEAMNSRVTRSTDGDPNGVLYVFAEQPGARDLFGEFRSAARPLEPLIDRVNEAHDGTRDSGPETPGIGPGGTLQVPAPGDDGGAAGEDEGESEGAEDEDDPGPDREVFVIRPADEPFVIVYIVLRKGGVLADAMRDTYARPAPEEPLAE